MQIELVFSPAPREVREWTLQIPKGCTLSAALAASALYEEFPDLKDTRLVAGVWGRKCNLAQVLEEGDRVEIYRGLQVDPKVARRERFSQQGARSAGLFAKKRVGAKAGY